MRKTLENVTELLAPLELTAEETGSIELVLAEALNNVVEHAYTPGIPGPVSLVVRHRRASLLFEVRDKGFPMPNGRAPDGKNPTKEVVQSTLPEGGFGWFLIRELANDLIYDRQDDENILIFRLAIGRKAT